MSERDNLTVISSRKSDRKQVLLLEMMREECSISIHEIIGIKNDNEMKIQHKDRAFKIPSQINPKETL